MACRYLHEFKVTKRVFKGLEQPVAFIGFPETSINKWMPEGAVHTNVDEKHLSIRLLSSFLPMVSSKDEPIHIRCITESHSQAHKSCGMAFICTL